MSVDIIDVSHYQGEIDWNKVKASGLKGVYMKADQGVNSPDSKIKINSLGASNVGLPIGYYHFASLNDPDEVKDAKAEANYFVSLLKQLPKSSLPIALDIEENKLIKLSKEEVLVWIKTFFAELHILGYDDICLYSYTSFLNANLPNNHGLGAIKLWLAGYVAVPVIPKGWIGYWLWQYTSKGRIDGINADVDLNRYQ